MILTTSGNLLTCLSSSTQLATPNSPLQVKATIDQSMARFHTSLDQVELEIVVAETYLRGIKEREERREREEVLRRKKLEQERALQEKKKKAEVAAAAAAAAEAEKAEKAEKAASKSKDTVTSKERPSTAEDQTMLDLFDDSMLDFEGNASNTPPHRPETTGLDFGMSVDTMTLPPPLPSQPPQLSFDGGLNQFTDFSVHGGGGSLGVGRDDFTGFLGSLDGSTADAGVEPRSSSHATGEDDYLQTQSDMFQADIETLFNDEFLIG